MRLVDTHCHVQDAKFDEDRAAVIERAREALDWFVVVGDDLSTSRAAVKLCAPDIYAAVGFHPYHAALADAGALAELRVLAGQQGVKAIGEIGLDYFNEFCPRELQRKAFPAQMALAAELGLPVVIHNRDADDDTLSVLREFSGDWAGCVMHCFGSGAAFAEACISLGCHVSFAGNVTYPKAHALREAASVVPMDRLLIETDAPYLAPQVRRGKRCEPADVVYTAEALADLKGLSIEVFAGHIRENAARFFAVGM